LKAFITAIFLVTLAFSSVCSAQDSTEDAKVLKAFTIPVPINGGPFWTTIVTDRTADILWQGSPSRDSLKSESAETGLALYVMGLVTRDFELVPEYSIMQGKISSHGKAINIRNLSGGTMKQGDIVLGLIEFENKIDLTQPFTLIFSGCSVQVVLNQDDVKRWGSLSSSQQDAGGPPPGR